MKASRQASEKDDLLPEYDFSAGVRGKHYRAFAEGGNVALLEPDVAAAFPDSASVNRALRLLMDLAKSSVPLADKPTPAKAKTKSPRRTSARTTK